MVVVSGEWSDLEKRCPMPSAQEGVVVSHPDLTYLSLGWGVQSWTLAAMVALGELPPVDLAIHADTTHEAAGTYAHAEKWTPWLGERGVQVVTVTGDNTEVVRDWAASRSVMIPALTLARDGSHGQIKRQCTHDWKLTPIRRHLRQLIPNPKPGAVECWQGISLDEWSRMRDSDVRYIVNRYPLVERRMTRRDCVSWLMAHGLDVPPKSACVFCPYHSLGHWKAMKAEGGRDWQRAEAVDAAVRDHRPGHQLFVHPGRKPLIQAVKIPEDQGAKQLEMDLPCDGGVCFV